MVKLARICLRFPFYGVGQNAVSLAERVTVMEEAPLVSATLASTAGLITGEQLKDLLGIEGSPYFTVTVIS